MKHADSIKLARKAFTAYERAVKAAEDARKLGPPRDLGTCIMTLQKPYTYSNGSWHCSECDATFGGQQSETRNWKFCPHCGAEIMRFDEGEAEAVTKVVASFHEPEEERVRRAHRENKLASDRTIKRIEVGR